jgi:ribosomal protein S18 acetylase RimI-like enzyme
MLLRPMLAGDVAEVSQLHYALLPGLLTDLGPGVIRYFYATALELDGTAAWVVVDDNARVQGLALVTDSGATLYGRVFGRRPFTGVTRVAGAAFLRPAAVLRTANWFLKDRPASQSADTPELVYIAVAPAVRGTGRGRLLFTQASDSIRSRGFGQFQLSVDADDTPVQRFYEKMGGECVATYVEAGIHRKRYAFRYDR